MTFRHPVLQFTARRLLAAALVVLAVSALTFSFIHLAPGGPEQTIAGRFATPEQLEGIRDSYGLDDPLPAQYADYLVHAVRLDFGNSISTREPVVTAMQDRLGVTAPLILGSFVLICILGTGLGTLAAYRKGSGLDRFLVGVAVTGASAPAFATAIILVFVFGVQLGWFPTFGDGEGLADRARHLVLPVIALTLVGVASMLKITRARVAQVLQEDHVTFARARGLRPSYIVGRSVLRNAGIQVVTQSGVILLALVAGGVLVEVTFGLNGVGALFIKAIEARDIPVIQAVSLLITLFIVLVNLAVDLLYFALDPRVRAQPAGARA